VEKRSSSRSVSAEKKKTKKSKKGKGKKKQSSSSSSSSSSESESEVEKKKKKKKKKTKSVPTAGQVDGVTFLPIPDDFDLSKERKRLVIGGGKSAVNRRIADDLSVKKVREMIIHTNAKSGENPIFSHVDCEKLPKNPEAAPDKSTSVQGGNLLAAMFGTVEEDDEEDTVEEPQALVRKKAEMDKEEKPRGTTGIKIHERITWWQEASEAKSDKKKKPVEKKKKKKKKVVSSSESEELEIVPKKKKKKEKARSPSPKYVRTVNQDKEAKKSKKSLSRARSRSFSMSPIRSPNRTPIRAPRSRTRSPRRTSRRRSTAMSISRSRSRSRSRSFRRGRSRSFRRSRSRSPRIQDLRRPRRSRSCSIDESRQPCVFFFSKEAKGCKWTARECKFSHNQDDYEYWQDKKGSILPNTGLIFRKSPVRKRGRSYSPRR